MEQKGTLNILRGIDEGSCLKNKDTLNDFRGIDEESSQKPQSQVMTRRKWRSRDSTNES